MRRENLEMMGAEELEQYAKILGFTARAAKGAEAKARLISERRERTATVEALGLELTVPIKRMRDKRVVDLYAKKGRSDQETYDLMRLVLGDEQMEEVIEACTEEDGTVDLDALGLVFARVIFSDQLKNF